MAKKTESSSRGVKKDKPKVSRPGRHSKKRTSKRKESKHYLKRSRGQG
jgi:hypothetical protein